jgi:hypothetical protein
MNKIILMAAAIALAGCSAQNNHNHDPKVVEGTSYLNEINFKMKAELTDLEVVKKNSFCYNNEGKIYYNNDLFVYESENYYCSKEFGGAWVHDSIIKAN